MTPTRDALARGQPFRLLSGGVGIVGELIGSGGQGSVYAVDTAGRRLALKWYHSYVALADVTLRAPSLSALPARRQTRIAPIGPAGFFKDDVWEDPSGTDAAYEALTRYVMQRSHALVSVD